MTEEITQQIQHTFTDLTVLKDSFIVNQKNPGQLLTLFTEVNGTNALYYDRISDEGLYLSNGTFYLGLFDKFNYAMSKKQKIDVDKPVRA